MTNNHNLSSPNLSSLFKRWITFPYFPENIVSSRTLKTLPLQRIWSEWFSENKLKDGLISTWVRCRERIKLLLYAFRELGLESFSNYERSIRKRWIRIYLLESPILMSLYFSQTIGSTVDSVLDLSYFSLIMLTNKNNWKSSIKSAVKPYSPMVCSSLRLSIGISVGEIRLRLLRF